MTCEKAKELFSELNEGTLTEGLRLKASQHLAGCAACEHEFESFKKTLALFSTLSPVSVPDDLSEIIARRLDRVDYEVKRSRSSSSGWFRFATVGVAAAAFIGVFFLSRPTERSGIQAGIAPQLGSKQTDVRAEKVGDTVHIRFIAAKPTRVDVFEGGKDFASLPPLDAKQVRVDNVASGARYDVPLEVTGILPQPLWLTVAGADRAIGIFFPQPGALTARSFEGNTVQALQAIANGYGVIVEAHLIDSGKKAQHQVEGEDALEAAKATLAAGPYKEITLQKGILRVR